MDPEYVTLLKNFNKIATRIVNCQHELLDAENFIQDTYKKIIDTFEEDYRLLAVAYHTTEKCVRYPPDVPGIVGNPFEISSKEEYAKFFVLVEGLVGILEKALNETQIHGRPEAFEPRAHMVQHLYVDATELILRLLRVKQDLETYIGILQKKNLKYLQDSSIVAWDETAAYRPGETVDPIHRWPFRAGEEWRLFCAWVSSLPETQLAVRDGRLVDVAMKMLHERPERYMPSASDKLVNSFFSYWLNG